MKRFYYPESLTLNQLIILPIELVRHIFALRLKLNENIILFNGAGQNYVANIISIERKQVIIRITEVMHSINPIQTISLALCVIANDKMDFAIQKAVELGANQIIPIISERSQNIPHDRLNKKLEHWQSIIISSCEQCGQNYLPKLEVPLKLTTLITQYNYDYKTWLSLSYKHTSNTLNKNIKNILLLVGPEGGLTQSEEDLMYMNNYIPMNLGNLILRAETAVCAGLSVINYRLGIYNG